MSQHSERFGLELYQAQNRHRKLPVFSARIPGESLSSWIVRLADGQGMSANKLGYWLVGRGRQLFGEDLDRGSWQELLNVLAIATCQSPDDLTEGTLKIYEGRLWGELASNGSARWVLPIVKRGTTWDGFGNQFCPACLASDAVPHMRLSWRLSFVVCCPVHRCMLADRCWACGTGVNAQRWRTGRLRPVGTSGIIYCHSCGADRREASQTVEVRDSLIQAQASMTGVLDVGGVEIDGRNIHSLAFFSGVAGIWNLLDTPRYSEIFWKYFQVRTPEFPPAGRTRYGSFERHSVATRSVLLEGYFELMRNGPSLAVQTLKQAGFSSGHLLGFFRKERTPAPFWLWEPVHTHLNKFAYIPSDFEIQNAIRYQLRITQHPFVRIRDVCKLLGMATVNNKRVANEIYKMGALNLLGRSRSKPRV